VLDDHDHVWGDKIRFSSEAASEHQVAAAVALQLFSLGIPCIYYGTEQSLAGPEASERGFLPNWNRADGSGYATRYLREAMFGPTHPRQPKPGDPAAPEAALNKSLPGFGPFGTAGAHCFDEHSPAFLRIAALTAVRRKYPVLRSGRQYLRQLSFLGKPFAFYGPGEIVAWSRVLGETEALCLFNSHGSAGRGADVLVDASLNPTGSSLTVALNTAQAASPQPSSYNGFHPVGSSLPVRRRPDGTAYVEVRSVTASEVLVLLNRP
jgi:glycosidase